MHSPRPAFALLFGCARWLSLAQLSLLSAARQHLSCLGAAWWAQSCMAFTSMSGMPVAMLTFLHCCLLTAAARLPQRQPARRSSQPQRRLLSTGRQQLRF